MLWLALVGCGRPPPPPAPEPEPVTEPEPEPEPTFEELDLAGKTAALRERGEAVYGERCARCHGADGKGIPGAFPPLLGPGQVRGDCDAHGRLVTEGLIGVTLVADGITYNSVMPPTELEPFDLAAVLTWERTSWGNDLGPCLP